MNNPVAAWPGRVRLVTIAAALLLAACGPRTVQPPEGPAPRAGAPITLNGAGATFPFPLYSKWSQVYAAQQGVQINYQSVGSGGGIRQFIARTVDFGATDGPMTDEQITQAGGTVLHIPTVAGAVVPVYNLPGVTPPLNFTGELLAAIFLGQVVRWDDPQVARLNPGTALPAEEIVVIHRSDGSGTTVIWTNFLGKVSPEWKQRVGEGTSVSWPTGLGGKGNEGVAQLVNRTPYALGYVELAYALTSKMRFGNVRNRSGRLVTPSLESTTAAVAGAVDPIPEDFRIFITHPTGPDAYPIAGFTWILARQAQADAQKGQALAEFLWWATHDGQRYAAPLLYAPLPPRLVDHIEVSLRRMTAAGQRLLP
jgi:phosphate transport system substrate-binding protein